jgi:hypothetical protein
VKKKTWQFVERHGLWWAHEGELPPADAFKTHGRPPQPPILGPFPSRVIAEALLGRHLSRRGNDGRIHADPSGG